MSDVLITQLAMKEIETYGQNFIELLEGLPDGLLWDTTGNLPNSIGVLARHLTGNLNHYFGAAILKTGYHRDRDREFSETGLPKAVVIADLKAALKVARQAVDAIDPARINQPHTSPEGTTHESLGGHILHMAAHFALHYGQADYARHFLKSVKKTAASA